VGALHLKVECLPKTATAEALAGEMIDTGSMDNAKVLVVTGNLNRDVLVARLEGARAIVDCLQVYKTEGVDLSSDPAAADFRRRGADAVLFASSSSAQCFVDQGETLRIGEGATKPIHGSIGPQTSETMRRVGLSVDFEAPKPGIDPLIAELVRTLK
jgi:uroporphyrinogen-III synthase